MLVFLHSLCDTNLATWSDELKFLNYPKFLLFYNVTETLKHKYM